MAEPSGDAVGVERRAHEIPLYRVAGPHAEKKAAPVRFRLSMHAKHWNAKVLDKKTGRPSAYNYTMLSKPYNYNGEFPSCSLDLGGSFRLNAPGNQSR
jgi:hypothetical protein